MTETQTTLANDTAAAIVSADTAAELAFALCLKAYKAGLRQRDVAAAIRLVKKTTDSNARKLASIYWPKIVCANKTNSKARKTVEDKAATAYKRLKGQHNGNTKAVIIAIAKLAGLKASDLS